MKRDRTNTFERAAKNLRWHILGIHLVSTTSNIRKDLDVLLAEGSLPHSMEEHVFDFLTPGKKKNELKGKQGRISDEEY